MESPAMVNEFKACSAHSAEHFGDTRDHWWHDDFIDMVALHWQLEAVRTVLDVGCGVGHWSRTLARVLPHAAEVIGVDREELWIAKAAQRAAAAGLSQRFQYRLASAESLPFDDGAFDLVTCQTLLMHVSDPKHVLDEMSRVTRPGGLVLAAEPTNVAGPLVDSIVLDDPPEISASLLCFQLICERGKRALGEGNNLIGESLPQLFVRAGLKQVGIRQNDRGWSLVPPYSSPFERAQVEELLDAVERGRWIWDEATARRYFLAGGGNELDFPQRWSTALAQRRRLAEAFRAQTYSCAGGGLFYLAWGFKPPTAAARLPQVAPG
jgi:SAM-dependent methyltransferase